MSAGWAQQLLRKYMYRPTAAGGPLLDGEVRECGGQGVKLGRVVAE